MGALIIAHMLSAVIAAILVFRIAKMSWQTPWLLNVFGALFVFAGAITLSGWLTKVIFDGYMLIRSPDVQWYSWMFYLGISVCCYLPAAYASKKKRQIPANTQ